ncbi:ribosome assembly RNA-binding protein YhbY [Celerinatantimonas sp. MCCC 1A17872]|uniref:ribosome assembly RNA-binding protein YhbY n=1 Tax=Celerinatantimonas sp. MCCC 1A17872 TaxID=3177514 RepID=UPI0038C9DCF2
MQLSNKQKQFLKGLAHKLKPVVLLGSNGLTEGVLAEIDSALATHELIKVKIPSGDRELKAQIAQTIALNTEATLVQTIGNIGVYYRPSEEPKIELPR